MFWAGLLEAVFFVCQALIGISLIYTADDKDCDLWVSSAVLYAYLWIILLRDFALWQKHIRIGIKDVCHLWQVPDLVFVPCLLLWLFAAYHSANTEECIEKNEVFSDLLKVTDIALVALSLIYAIRCLIFTVHTVVFIFRCAKTNRSYKQCLSSYLKTLLYLEKQTQ